MNNKNCLIIIGLFTLLLISNLTATLSLTLSLRVKKAYALDQDISGNRGDNSNADNKIPLQYIVSIKNNVTADPQSIANKFIAEGAQILHVYRYALKGFTVLIPSNHVLSDILSDPRIDAVEQDQIEHVASASAHRQ